jgi:hypothetical protein
MDNDKNSYRAFVFSPFYSTFFCSTIDPKLLPLAKEIKWLSCVSSGFSRDVDEIFANRGCHVALVVSYRRFGTTYLISFLSVKTSKKNWTVFPLKQRQIDGQETSVTNKQSTLHNIAEERKSGIFFMFIDPCIVVWISRNNQQDATL